MAKEDLISSAVTVVRIMTLSLFDFHLSCFAFLTGGGGGGAAYSGEFLAGVCRPARFSKSWPLFQTKKCNFPQPFSDQTSKIHTRFQTWPLRRNYVIITSD